jgi:hypothetical protein
VYSTVKFRISMKVSLHIKRERQHSNIDLYGTALARGVSSSGDTGSVVSAAFGIRSVFFFKKSGASCWAASEAISPLSCVHTCNMFANMTRKHELVTIRVDGFLYSVRNGLHRTRSRNK